MYPVSNAYREKVVDTSRVWDLRIDITLVNGTTLNLTKEHLKLGSFVYKDGAVCSEAIHTGATYSCSVEFTILNEDKQYSEYEFYGAKVYPRVGLDTSGSGTFEYVPLGEFNVIEPVKKLSTIPMVCFDNMVLLNKPFDFSSMVFPTTIGVVYTNIIKQCGISATPSLDVEISALDYSISSFLTNDPTCRDILAGMGVMLLKNLRFNRQGLLESYWYETCSVYTNEDMRVGNSSFGDAEYVVSGVFVEDAYGNVFSHGTSDYPVELPTSPVLQGSDMVFPILEKTLRKLQERPCRPASITWIGDPSVQAGDVIEHLRTSIGSVQLSVMRVIYKFAGTSTLESLSPDSSSLVQPTSTDRKMRKAFEVNRQNFEELRTEVNQTAEAVELVASKVAHLQIGARNLIRNSINMIHEDYDFSLSDGLNSLESYKGTIMGKEDECARFVIGDASDPFVLSNVSKTGDQYTLSFWAKAGEASAITVCDEPILLTTEWQKYKVTYTATSTDLLFEFDTEGVYYIYHPQLELGELVTDWAPAPEDTDDAIASTNRDIESVRESVAQLSVDTDAIRASVSDVEGTINSVSGELEKTKENITTIEATATQAKIDIQTIQDEGVGKVSNTTGVFDKTGLTVDNTESPTKTTVTPDGMKVYRKTGVKDEEVLIASSSGVDATNLHAKTYLIVGGRSRFENYETNRTGCFWVGGAS